MRPLRECMRADYAAYYHHGPDRRADLRDTDGTRVSERLASAASLRELAAQLRMAANVLDGVATELEAAGVARVTDPAALERRKQPPPPAPAKPAISTFS